MGQFLEETGASLGAQDEGPFEMRLLHFRRTFLDEDVRQPCQVSRRSRRWASRSAATLAITTTLVCLADRPEVLAMLRSEEYAAIKADYDRVSTAHFPKSYVPPPEMSFARSDALFPPGDLRATIAAAFEAQCRMLCFGPSPTC